MKSTYIHWKAQEDWPMRFAVDISEEHYLLVRSVYFSIDEETQEPELRLIIELKKSTFLTIESLRWFSIPVVYTNRNQINFHEDAPIFLEILFQKWEIMTAHDPIPANENNAWLAYIFTHLQENKLMFSPLSYRVVEVHQTNNSKRISFNWEQIQQWEYGS